MPTLPVARHPEFSRRDILLLQCLDQFGVAETAARFNLSHRHINYIRARFRGKRTTYKWIRNTEQIISLYFELKSAEKVAATVGRDRRTIERLLRRHSIPILGKPGRPKKIPPQGGGET